MGYTAQCVFTDFSFVQPLWTPRWFQSLDTKKSTLIDTPASSVPVNTACYHESLLDTPRIATERGVRATSQARRKAYRSHSGHDVNRADWSRRSLSAYTWPHKIGKADSPIAPTPSKRPPSLFDAPGTRPRGGAYWLQQQPRKSWTNQYGSREKGKKRKGRTESKHFSVVCKYEASGKVMSRTRGGGLTNYFLDRELRWSGRTTSSNL